MPKAALRGMKRLVEDIQCQSFKGGSLSSKYSSCLVFRGDRAQLGRETDKDVDGTMVY